MRNVLTVLRRDLVRLLRVPVAWVIALGLMVLPATYAWVNIIGFWDPYGNTGNVQVSVANRDRGTDSALMGRLDLGRQVVDSLRRNHDLHWKITDAAQALDDVERGDSYAAIIIPRDFSDDIGAVITGGGTRPRLDYYVNEKASPIAPKVTDTAAGTVEEQINGTFVATVAQTVSRAVNQAGGAVAAGAVGAIGTATGAIGTVTDDIAQARKAIEDLNGTLGDVPQRTAEARAALASVRTLGDDASASLQDVSGLLDGTRTALADLSSSASGLLGQGSGLLTQASSLADTVAGQTSGALSAAHGPVAGALSTLRQASDTVGGVVDALRAHTGQIDGIDDALAALQAANTGLTQGIDTLSRLNDRAAEAATVAGRLGGDLDTAVGNAVASVNGAQQTLLSRDLPRLDGGLASLSGVSATLANGLSGQRTLLDQADTVLGQLDRAASSAHDALAQTDQALAGAATRLDTLGTDLTALGDANALRTLAGGRMLDSRSLSAFMRSPTVLHTHTIDPVNSYGSGMAPLFTSLALWAGAFMLVVIFRLEADGEGIPGLTATQGYLGRWLFLAILALGQGVVTAVGDLVIGVQTVSAPLFLLTAVITSLVDIAIAYALSTTFLHIGKALCVILIIVQIPGASGLYPIEMMPAFFRDLYPYFPFSHSIAALRETIGGMYGARWGQQVGWLLVFAALAFLLGLVIRPRLANVNRLFAREIAQSDIILGEPVRLRGREYPIAQVLRVLGDRAEYRAAIERRAASFAELYPKLKRGALAVGLGVPAVLCVVFSLTTDTKLVALGTWTVWVLAVIAFLLGIEYVRDSIRRQTELGNLDDASIRRVIAERARERDEARAARETRRRQRRERRLRKGARRPAGAVTPGTTPEGGVA